MCWLSHLPDLEGMQSTDEICCFGLHKGFGYVRAVLGLLQFLLNFDFFLLCLLWAPIQQRVSVKHLSHLCMVNLEAERTYICMCSLMYSLLLLWCWGPLCCWQQQGLAVSSSLTWLCDAAAATSVLYWEFSTVRAVFKCCRDAFCWLLIPQPALHCMDLCLLPSCVIGIVLPDGCVLGRLSQFWFSSKPLMSNTRGRELRWPFWNKGKKIAQC